MSEEDLTKLDPSSSPAAEAAVSAPTQRQPLMQQVCESFAYMTNSANTEFKRGTDKTSAAVLPLACVLLIAAISISTTPQWKAMSFLAPLAAFLYYLASRVGIVRTMNPRQAYLTFHMLIATFLLGGTVALFLLMMMTVIFISLNVH